MKTMGIFSYTASASQQLAFWHRNILTAYEHYTLSATNDRGQKISSKLYRIRIRVNAIYAREGGCSHINKIT